MSSGTGRTPRVYSDKNSSGTGPTNYSFSELTVNAIGSSPLGGVLYPSLPDRLYDEIESLKTPLYPAYGTNKSGYDENDNERILLALPGHGASKFSCGRVRFATKCSNDGCEEHQHLHLVKDHCGSLTCPVCYEIRCKRDSEAISERINGMKSAYQAENVKIGPIDHVEISFAPGTYNEDDLATREGQNQFYHDHAKLLKKYCHGYGGALIPHLHRFKHPDGTSCENKMHCDKPHIPEFSPHCHYIGWGYWEKSDKVHRETGAVYKKISPGRSRDVKATAFYLLTHVGLWMVQKQIIDSETNLIIPEIEAYKQIGKTYRWYGMLSQSKGGFKEESRSWDVERCEKCQCEIHKYDLDVNEKGEYYTLKDIGEHLVLTIQGFWYISHKAESPKKYTQSVLKTLGD